MAAKKNQTPPKSFEDALAELEQILSDIEGGEVPLEQSLSMYERGQFLIGHCRGVLAMKTPRWMMSGSLSVMYDERKPGWVSSPERWLGSRSTLVRASPAAGLATPYRGASAEFTKPTGVV